MPDERYLEPEAETMSREGLDALQAEKLLELVSYAYEQSQLYRQLWQDEWRTPSGHHECGGLPAASSLHQQGHGAGVP